MHATFPYLTDAHLRLRRQAQEFAREEITPRVRQMEAAGTHAETELPKLMGAMGWFGVLIGSEHGGMGAGHVAKSVLLDETSYASGAVGGILQASLIPTVALQYLGSDEQLRQWLPLIAAGDLYLTIAVTEPDRGGHVLGMASTARRKGREWMINATKCFIGNSGIAGLHVVVVRTGKPGQSRSLSAFLVEADRPGVEVTQPPFVGMRGFTTGTLRLRDVRVPAANLLGQVGDGLTASYLPSVVCGRPNFAAVALGLHRRVIEITTGFLTQRPRYDATLADLPVVRRHLAEMTSRLMAAEVVAYHAVHLLDQGVPCDAELVNSKVFGNRAAVESVGEAKTVHGGYAVRADYELARLDRDIAHLAAPAGPDDIQLLRLGETALGSTHRQWSERFVRRTRPQSPAPAAA